MLNLAKGKPFCAPSDRHLLSEPRWSFIVLTYAWGGCRSWGQGSEEEALHLTVRQSRLHELLTRSWDDRDPLRYDLQLAGGLTLALNHHRQRLLSAHASLPVHTRPTLLPLQEPQSASLLVRRWIRAVLSKNTIICWLRILMISCI